LASQVPSDTCTSSELRALGFTFTCMSIATPDCGLATELSRRPRRRLARTQSATVIHGPLQRVVRHHTHFDGHLSVTRTSAPAWARWSALGVVLELSEFLRAAAGFGDLGGPL